MTSVEVVSTMGLVLRRSRSKAVYLVVTSEILKLSCECYHSELTNEDWFYLLRVVVHLIMYFLPCLFILNIVFWYYQKRRRGICWECI